MIGCVMCSPGCFSLFRSYALMDDNVTRKWGLFSFKKISLFSDMHQNQKNQKITFSGIRERIAGFVRFFFNEDTGSDHLRKI